MLVLVPLTDLPLTGAGKEALRQANRSLASEAAGTKRRTQQRAKT